MFGWLKKKADRNEDVHGGKYIMTDVKAPKVIQSEEPIAFEAEFYRYADVVYTKERGYRFQMKQTEKGSFLISEDSRETYSCETGKEFAGRLQQLIRKYNLVRLNGVCEYTRALPPEYAPQRLKVEYASGEKLDVCTDGNPEEEWTGAVLDLFAKELGSHGIDNLLPPREDFIMTGFSLEYTFGAIRYLYGEIEIPAEELKDDPCSVNNKVQNGEDVVKMAFSSPWDRSQKTERKEEKMAEITEEHYCSLQEIVSETDLLSFQNGKIFPGGFDYEKTPQYYEFYIEYLSGKVISGFSDDPLQCEKFRPIAEKIATYYEKYLETNRGNAKNYEKQ